MADKGADLPPSSLEQQDREIAELEIANGFLQFDRGIEVIEFYLEPYHPFQLNPSLILMLQEIAVKGLLPNPGKWRQLPAKISQSKHTPPEAFRVEMLVQELCDYVNNNWHEKSGFHLAAYVMWRLNWIHPFDDGNGRTSRMLSYIVLLLKCGYVIPGTPTIPQQIQSNRSSYFKALESADCAYAADGSIDVSEMETLIKSMLATQLISVIDRLDGSGNPGSQTLVE